MLKITITKLPRLSLLLGVWLWCFSLNSFAQSASCSKPTVFYVNGVNTNLTAAHEGAKELSAAIAEKFPQHGVTVRAIHNPSESLLSDLPEVAVTQHWLQVGINFILAVTSITNPGLSAWLQNELDDVAAIFRRIDAIENIKKIVLAQIKATSAPVILIAHSQGNIMVNEAVRQLKTNSATANISGVKTIAVLGIGVADKQNMASLLANGENTNLYRYITSDSDLVLKPLQGILPPNFVVIANRSFDISNHLLIGSYLSIENLGYRGSSQNLQPGAVNSRSVVVGLFDEVYRNAAQAWPCFTLSSTPSPSAVGQEVAFSVKGNDRLSGEPLAGQALSLAFGDVTSPTLICSATLDANGNASCRQTFIAPARTEKAWINYRPVALPGFMSDYYFQGITAGTTAVTSDNFKFEVAEIEPGFGSGISCSRMSLFTTMANDLSKYTADVCNSTKGAVIRCVGSGCISGRFFASILVSKRTAVLACVFPSNPYCNPITSVNDAYGVDPVAAAMYAPGPWWYGLTNGRWVKAWPSVSDIGLNHTIYQNITILNNTGDNNSLYFTNSKLELVYNVYDTVNRSYTQYPLTVTLP